MPVGAGSYPSHHATPPHASTADSDFLASRTTKAHESWLSADYHYADDDGAKSTDALRYGVQHDHRISDRFYLGVTGGFLTDSTADVDYRFDFGTHVGWHAEKDERARLSFVSLNSRLSWRNAATRHFENQPSFGKQRQGTTLTSGIAVRFW